MPEAWHVRRSFKDLGVFHFVVQYSRVSEACPSGKIQKKMKICRGHACGPDPKWHSSASHISLIRTVADTPRRAGRWECSQNDTREKGHDIHNSLLAIGIYQEIAVVS